MREILNYRYYILESMITIGAVLVLGDVCYTKSFTYWLLLFIAYKTIGIALFAVAYKLYKRWERRNKIPFFTKLLKLLSNDD